MVDIVICVWIYKWKIDFIVWFLIDIDFYKFLMC